MITEETAGAWNVIGRRMAIVPEGPSPGKTPVNVPRMTPIGQYKRLIG
jgi:hypothetical protein